MNEHSKPFRLVVTGSRNYRPSPNFFDKVMENTILQLALRRGEIYIDEPESTLDIAEGGAEGADKMVREWVTRMDSKRVTHKTFEADWKKHGLTAGPRRNTRMLDEWNPEMVLAIWDGKVVSSGTLDCMRKAIALGIPVLVEPTKRKLR